jgi:hypothetical protein
MYAFYLEILCRPLDWQVVSAAQIFHGLGTVFSTVEHLTLKYWRDPIPSDTNDEADHMQWHELLRLFGNVKIFHVDYMLVRQLSCLLQVDDGESPLDLLPNLEELSNSSSPSIHRSGNPFDSFILSCQQAGHPVALVHC